MSSRHHSCEAMNDQKVVLRTFSAVDEAGKQFEIHEIAKLGTSHTFLKLKTGEPVNDLGYGRYQVVTVGQHTPGVLIKI